MSNSVQLAANKERRKSRCDCLGTVGSRSSSKGDGSDKKRKRMGKQPVRMKAVVYALSPFQQKVMPGLWKDLPGKIHHKVSENWISATLLLSPLVGVYTYVQNYQEKEKLSHRY
ncbi:cytochrome b-c1 complex subunit 8-like [Populus alba x Populus x berolinensis]|nr:cytochrome b-c1 complex subunit 8-like [Populus alba x Populus x berolinensis]